MELERMAQARLALQQSGFSLDDMLLAQERLYIDAALDIAQNNISEAAKLLGINRTTLYSRMESQQKHRARKGAEGEQ
jgi:DNA-binding NtrC family response regulator